MTAGHLTLDADKPIMVPFSPEHLNHPLAAEWAKYPSFTGMLPDGTILGGAGIIPIWPGTGRAWAFLMPGAEKYKLWIVKAIRKMIPDIAKELGLWRVEATIEAGITQNERFASTCGFEYIATIPGYGADGKAYSLYHVLLKEQLK
jgi:hypothetical protein